MTGKVVITVCVMGATALLSSAYSGGARAHAAGPCPAIVLPRQATTSPRRCGLYFGTERWQVKTLSDPDARRVQLTPVATTVESLAALPRPRYLPPYGRSGRTETTIFCVEGWLKDFTTELGHGSLNHRVVKISRANG